MVSPAIYLEFLLEALLMFIQAFLSTLDISPGITVKVSFETYQSIFSTITPALHIGFVLSEICCGIFPGVSVEI